MPAPDQKNPYMPGAANPYVMSPDETPASSEPPVRDEEQRPTTTKPRQRPNGAPAAPANPMGIQQGFAALVVSATCATCGAEAEAPITAIARLGRCGACGSTDIGLSDEINKTAVDERQNYSCRNCGKEITHTSDGWIHVGGDAYCNQSAGDAKATPKTASVIWDRQQTKPTLGSGDGYYVLRMGAPISGPYGSASDAHQELTGVNGDAVQFLTGAQVTPGPTLMTHPLRFGQPVASKSAARDADMTQWSAEELMAEIARVRKSIDDALAVRGPRSGPAFVDNSPAFGPYLSELLQEKTRRLQERNRAPKESKATQIVEGILATNPGMDRTAAFSLAQRTIDRFPGVLGKQAAVRTFDYKTVLDQIGRSELMNVGARDFMFSDKDNSVHFTIGMGRPKTKCIVTLDDSDTYTLEIGHSDRNYAWVSDYKASDIYADVLGQVLHQAWNGVMDKRGSKRTAASDRIEYTMERGGPATFASAIARDVASIPSGGSREFVLNGKGFTVYYDEQGAMGDSGAPVRGDVTGEFEVYSGLDGPMGLKSIGNVHVSPHGSSGYGNPQAKSYAVEQVANMIARAAT